MLAITAMLFERTNSNTSLFLLMIVWDDWDGNWRWIVVVTKATEIKHILPTPRVTLRHYCEYGSLMKFLCDFTFLLSRCCLVDAPDDIFVWLRMKKHTHTVLNTSPRRRIIIKNLIQKHFMFHICIYSSPTQPINSYIAELDAIIIMRQFRLVKLPW